MILGRYLLCEGPNNDQEEHRIILAVGLLSVLFCGIATTAPLTRMRALQISIR
jgi:hypothetical protein